MGCLVPGECHIDPAELVYLENLISGNHRYTEGCPGGCLLVLLEWTCGKELKEEAGGDKVPDLCEGHVTEPATCD